MSWGAIAGAVIGGVVAKQGQDSANRANKAAAKDAGKVDLTTTRTGDPAAEAYRKAALERAWAATGNAPPKVPPPPSIAGVYERPGGGTGGGGSTTHVGANNGGIGSAPMYSRAPGEPGGAVPAPGPQIPPGHRLNARGQVVPIGKGQKPATPAAPGAKPAPRAFDGMSQETADLRERMSTELPKANKALFSAGEDYVEDTLAGKTRNPLVDRATTAADAIADDPRLAAFQDALMADLGIGTGAAGSKPGRGTSQHGSNVQKVYYNSGSGAGAPGGAPPPNASATGTDAALRKLVAGELPAGWQGAEDAISRRVSAERAANIRDLRARAVGSGFYGGDLYKDLETGAIAKGDQELADELATARYDAFNNALGLGTQYDLGMADISSGERIAANNASTAAGAAGADLASREKLAKYGFLMDGLSLGEQGRFGKAGKLGDLAGLVSGDQKAALAGIGDITSGRRADLGAAADVSLGSDAARNNFIGNNNQLRAAQMAAGNDRAALNFDRERFYDPMSRLGSFNDILAGLYGGYGTETTTGLDKRNVSAPAIGSSWGAIASGAAVGGQIGSQYGKRS